MTILVVDDVASNRSLLRMLVERMGHAVVEARDGLEALRLLEEHPEVAAMVLDITMPRLNGWGVLGRMRERPEWHGVPVILFTAVADRETVQRASGYGVRQYLVKPATADRVARTMEAALAAVGPRLEPVAALLARTGIEPAKYQTALQELAAVLRTRVDQNGTADASTEALARLEQACVQVGAARSAAVVRRLLGGVANQHGVTTADVLAREVRLLLSAVEERLGVPAPAAPAVPASDATTVAS